MNTQILAYDGGFGNTKIAYKNGDGHIHVEYFPSVVGLGHTTDLGLLTTGLNGRHRQVKPFVVEFSTSPLRGGIEGGGEGQGEVTYLAGPNLHRWTRPTERLDLRRLYEGPETRVLFYAALSGLLEPDEETHLYILDGFPVEILLDKPAAQSALASLKAWRLGWHEFCVDGVPYRVNVKAVKAIAQPLGSYFAWGLDEDGQWSRSAADFNAPVAVVDIGFNTLDLFGLERGQIVSRLTDGKSLGMHRAAESIKRHVSQAYGVELSLSQADELIREHVAGRDALVYHQNNTDRINPVVQQALDECFAAINGFLGEHIAGGGFRYLILTGGGAAALRQPLLRHYPAAICLPDPITANANGLARYARKLFKTDAPMPGA